MGSVRTAKIDQCFSLCVCVCMRTCGGGGCGLGGNHLDACSSLRVGVMECPHKVHLLVLYIHGPFLGKKFTIMNMSPHYARAFISKTRDPVVEPTWLHSW